MTTIVFSDNAYGTIGVSLAVGDTTVNFTTGHGARFPALSAGQRIYCTLIDTTNVVEEVIITAHSANADSATMTRGAGGTTAKAWVAGTRIEARLSSTSLAAAFGEPLTDAVPLLKSDTDNSKQIQFSAANVVSTSTALLTVGAAQVVEGVQGAVVASAGTINIGTSTGDYFHITGSATATALTLTQGWERVVVFDGAVTLTTSTNLILPTDSASLVAAAGDVAVFRGEAAGVARCLSYLTHSGALGSSMVLLSNQSASNSATMDFDSVISNLYDDYELKFNAVIPATNAVSLLFRVSTDNGATFLAGTQYNGSRLQNTASASTPAGAADSSAANLTICNSISNGSSGVWGTISIKRLTGGVCAIQWQVSWVDSSGVVETAHGGGIINATSMNAVRLLMSAGNITSGTFRLYGLKNS